MDNFVVTVRGSGDYPSIAEMSEKFIEQLVGAGLNVDDASALMGGELVGLPHNRPSVQPLAWSELERMQGEFAAELRAMLGEGPYAQELFTDEQRERRIKAMKKCALEGLSDEARHDDWCKMHVDSGWTYGETFDPVEKKHPNLVPWGELPEAVKHKARIFAIVSRAAQRLSDALGSV